MNMYRSTEKIRKALLEKHKVELIREFFQHGKNIRVLGSGECMKPFIKNEEPVIIKNIISPNEIRVGDIIVFYPTLEKKELTLNFPIHRVVRVRKNKGNLRFITKGDNSVYLDCPVSEDKIMGRVVAIEKTNCILRLDNRLWRLINYIISIQSYMSYLVYSLLYQKIRVVKRRLVGTKKIPLVNLGFRMSFLCFSLFSLFVINFFILTRNINSKFKHNTKGDI